MTQITRRGVLAGAVGVGSLALLGSQWPRLNGTDIPGRHDDSLSIAILGTNQDAEARQSLVKAFNTHHPDIHDRIQAESDQGGGRRLAPCREGDDGLDDVPGDRERDDDPDPSLQGRFSAGLQGFRRHR